MIIEVTHCGWLNMPNGVKNDLTSRGANFYLYFDHPFGKSNFSFAWGGGISSHNISGNSNVVYVIDSLGNETTVFEQRLLPYRKNVIGAKILEVPLEIRFRTRRDRSFKISLGIKGGFTVQNFRKIFDVDGKRKYYDIHNYNPWRYGITFRIGYEQIYLCGFYSLSQVIQKDKGSQGIIPYSIGIGITPW
ncbi:MAG: outer membrane beta-barrel protein [Bacteroidia bacterium]|nr:outer membrane beta-barrel protein [Bacteroidia bacterium]